MSPVPESNKDSPGHIDNIESMESPQFIIEAGSSESENDEDDPSYQYYQPLPQDPEDVEMSDEDMDTNSVGGNAAVYATIPNVIMDDEFPSLGSGSTVPDIPSAEAAERRNVWNKTPEAIRLDQIQEDKIKAAMANFSLPPINQPAWAKNIPEDLWKDKLLNRVTSSSDRKTSKNVNEQSGSNKQEHVSTSPANFADFDAFNSSDDTHVSDNS